MVLKAVQLNGVCSAPLGRGNAAACSNPLVAPSHQSQAHLSFLGLKLIQAEQMCEATFKWSLLTSSRYATLQGLVPQHDSSTLILIYHMHREQCATSIALKESSPARGSDFTEVDRLF